MSNFTLGPLPCKNPESFSKFSKSKEHYKNQKIVVHRSVEGENNGKCYKIKSSKTPFVLQHLEKQFGVRFSEPAKDSDEEEEEVEEAKQQSRKREFSDSEDPNEPSTSTDRKKKRR